MNNDSTQNGISRLGFLKRSGTIAAGLTLLQDSSFASAVARAVSGRGMGSTHTAELSDYQLVLPQQAGEKEEYAARQLQYYLQEISGISLPIKSESDYQGNAAIYLGPTLYASEHATNISRLKADGYTCKPAGDNLIIVGGTGKGLLYGVYYLLESLGCRKFTSTATYVPNQTKIALPDKEVTESPFIEYRSTSYRDTREPEYADWHRLSSRDSWGSSYIPSTGWYPPPNTAAPTLNIFP